MLTSSSDIVGDYLARESDDGVVSGVRDILAGNPAGSVVDSHNLAVADRRGGEPDCTADDACGTRGDRVGTVDYNSKVSG